MSAPFLSEAAIEDSAEREMNRVDAAYLAGRLTADEYDRRIRAIAERAERRYRDLDMERAR